MPLRRLLPLLSCPLCAVENAGTSRPPLLRNPFTLHCGHTVCASHLNTLNPTQPCPLPVCSSTANPNTTRPNIPSSSGVVYLPAAPPLPPARRSSPTSTDQRVDITISKLIEVVSRHSGPPPPPSDQGDSGLSDGDDYQAHPRGQRSLRTTLPSSEEETEFPATRDQARSSGQRGRRRRRRATELATQASTSASSARPTNVIPADSAEDARHPSPSEHAGRPCSPLAPAAGGENSDGGDSSPEPPKKRPRRDSRSLVTDRETQTRVIDPEAETSNSDYPNANTSHPSRSGAEPRQRPTEIGGGEDPRMSIDKELLTELNCEICFTIYYQPVTTPCQHVSRLFSFFFFVTSSGALSLSLPFHQNSAVASTPLRSRYRFFVFHPNPTLDPEVFISFLPPVSIFGALVSSLCLKDVLRQMPSEVSGPQEPLSHLQGGTT